MTIANYVDSNFYHINQQIAQELINKFSCPLYLIDSLGITNRLNTFQQIAQSYYPHSIVALSYKTNPLHGLLAKLHLQGAYAEVVSGEEYQIAKKLGVPGEKIIFNGPMKTDSELLESIQQRVYLNCDHMDEIIRIENIAISLGIQAKIGLRLCFIDHENNWNRFGFVVSKQKGLPNSVYDVIKKILGTPHLKLSGLHAHIGTNIRDIKRFNQLGRDMAKFATELLTEFNLPLEWLDVGGGLAGISPRIDEQQNAPHSLPDLDEYLSAIIEPLKSYLFKVQNNPILFFEPGRTLFEPFAALLTQVVGRRPFDSNMMGYICDAGFNSLATSHVYNHPIHIPKGSVGEKLGALYGPTCNQTDQLHTPLLLPELKPGDFILFYGVGAYCMSFSYSFIRYRPGVVLWDGGNRAEWLRYPESLDHAAKLEVIPPLFKPKKYLIIPSVPTPNGSLHLGHIGGPYLRADILARHLKMSGHIAYLACGTDSYESYVTLQASNAKLTPELICEKYHSDIEQDLLSMDISIDLFINLLEPQINKQYKLLCQKIFTGLGESQGLEKVEEDFFWDSQLNKYCQGCWLLGKCPYCDSGVAGYFCEVCGSHFKPEQIMSPEARLPYQALTKERVDNWFMKIPFNIPEYISGIPEAMRKVYMDFFKSEGSIRLTTKSEWGVNLKDLNDRPVVYFSYGFIYVYFLLIGEIVSKKLNLEKNVFSVDSDFITVNSFGIDNTVPFLASTYGVTGNLNQYKPFDGYLVNYFYNLNDYKFSTSRRHAIWAKDIVSSNLSSDITRLYLASISVDLAPGNFLLDEFCEFYNKTVIWIQDLILHIINEAACFTLPEQASNLTDKLTEIIEKQKNNFLLTNYRPEAAVKLIDEWIAIYNSSWDIIDKIYWLKGLVLLIYPFMPNLGGSLWVGLTGISFPNYKDIGVIAMKKKVLQEICWPKLITSEQIKEISAHLRVNNE